jgi:hypothetical protein
LYLPPSNGHLHFGLFIIFISTSSYAIRNIYNDVSNSLRAPKQIATQAPLTLDIGTGIPSFFVNLSATLAFLAGRRGALPGMPLFQTESTNILQTEHPQIKCLLYHTSVLQQSGSIRSILC